MYSLWATPTDKDRQYLSQIIHELSNIFNTLAFQPHCTLWSRVDLPLKNLIQVVKSSSQGITPFTVKVKGLDYSQSYDKTLFIQILANESLTILNRRIQNGLGENYHYQFDPHISLIYKNNMNKNTKRNIISTLSIKQSLKMENIVINKTGDPIEKWEMVYKQRLKH